MKTLTATPTTAKVDPKYWVFNGAPDGATAQNDTTRLSCTAVRTADTNIYQVHVDNVAKLFTGLTSLSTNTQAAPYSSSYANVIFGDTALGTAPWQYSPSFNWAVNGLGNYVYTGDPFVYVSDTSGFSSGQQLVVLEGDNGSSSPAFYSEWGQVGAAGQVAITQTIVNANYKSYSSSTAIPLPINVGNETVQPLYITTSGSTPSSTIAGFFPDWTYDYVVTASTAASPPNIVTFTPATTSTANAQFGSWAQGQIVFNAKGDYLGIVSTVTSTTVTATTGIPVAGNYTEIQFYPNSVVSTNWTNLVATTSLSYQSGLNVARSVSTTNGNPAPLETLTPGVVMPGNPIYTPYFSNGSYATISSLQSVIGSVAGGLTNGVDYLTISTTATVNTTATTYFYTPIFGSTVATGVVFGKVSTTPTATTGGYLVTSTTYTVATTGATTSTASALSIVDLNAYRMSSGNFGYGAESLGEVVSVATNGVVVPTTLAQPISYNGVTPTEALGTNDVFVIVNTDAAPSATILTPGGNQYELDLGPTPPYFSTYDPSPIGLSSVHGGSLWPSALLAPDTVNGPYASTGTNNLWFYPYGKNLVFTGAISNYKSSPVASFVSIAPLQQPAVPPPTTFNFNGTAKATPIYIHTFITGYTYSITGLSSSAATTIAEMVAAGTVTITVYSGTGSATNATVTSVSGTTLNLSSSAYVSSSGPITWTATLTQSYVVTCDDNSVVASLLASANASNPPKDLFLAFRGEGTHPVQFATPLVVWQVLSIPSGSTNTFVINNSSSSSYANQTNTYPNGDSQNYIYVWEILQNAYLSDNATSNPYYLAWSIPAGSTISNSSYNGGGPGVVTLVSSSTSAGQIGGVHNLGTTVGSYQLGKRWIGSNTTADLESLTVDQIGSRYTTTLFSEVKGGVSTSFIAGPAPAATSILANATFSVGATSITGITSTGIVQGMQASGLGISSGTVVTAVAPVSTTSTTGTFTTTYTVSLSNPTTASETSTPITFTSNIMNLTADISGDVSVVIVGMGKTQEAVQLSGAHQGIDGTNNNVPIIWDLVKGTQFRFDHAEGEPIFTPNILCFSNPLQNDHGVDTPVVGAPDLSSTTSATSSTALIAQNI